MSGLLDEVRAVRRSTVARCGLADFVNANLDDADRAELAEAFADVSVRTAAIFAVLKARGFPLRYEMVRKHRTGACSCPA